MDIRQASNFIESLQHLWETGRFPSSWVIHSPNKILGLNYIKDFITSVLSLHHTLKFEDNPEVIVVGENNTLEKKSASIGIDDIRKIKEFFSKKSLLSPYKFAVIVGSESMSNNAQNAFLKLLEEPQEGGFIFLIESIPNSMLETIYSRCRKAYTYTNANAMELSSMTVEFIELINVSKYSGLEPFVSKHFTKDNAKQNWPHFNKELLQVLNKKCTNFDIICHLDNLSTKNELAKVLNAYDKVSKILQDAEDFDLNKFQSLILISDALRGIRL